MRKCGDGHGEYNEKEALWKWKKVEGRERKNEEELGRTLRKGARVETVAVDV